MIGSFLNVLILRLPKEQDVILKSSHCPHCHKKLSWWMNIPLFSYLYLKGKCRYCSHKISWQYPLIELVTGLAAFLLVTFYPYDRWWELFFIFTIFCIFLVHTIIDLRHQILPDSLNLILAIMFLSYSLYHYDLWFWLLGGVIGFGFPLLVTWLFYLIRGQIGLGGGDIKLWGALGLYLGAQGIIVNIFISCLLGSVIGVLLIITKVTKRSEPIPFGPFILVVSFIQIIFPEQFSQLTESIFLP